MYKLDVGVVNHLVLHKLGVGFVDLHLLDLLLPLFAAQSSVRLEHHHLLFELSHAALHRADLCVLAGGTQKKQASRINVTNKPSQE